MKNEKICLFDKSECFHYQSKLKLAKDIQAFCDSGVIFISISKGECITRPEIQPLGNCVIEIKHLCFDGKIKNYTLVYEEVRYESLTFD